MPALEDIGRRIIAFLDQAIEERQPERDRQVAEAIMADLLALLPKDEPGWSEGIEQVARVVAGGLREQIDRWPQAIRLVAIYLHAAKIDADSEHPCAGDAKFKTRGKWHREVPVPLLVSVIRTLLAGAMQKEHKLLFEHSHDWEVFSVFIEPLPLLELDADDVALLLRRSDSFTKDMANRGLLLEPFRTWASRHVATAKDIVARWLQKEQGFSELEPSAIDLLVEGVVAHHQDELAWRDQVIDRLVAQGAVSFWKLAAYLACFAWPEDARPPVSQRHAALRHHVERMPERLVEAGLRAMWRDAGEHPSEAVQTGLSLLALQPQDGSDPEAHTRLAVEMADIAQKAAWTIEKRGVQATSPMPWSAILKEALHIPPDRVRVLDQLLSQLIETEPDLVMEFLPRWFRQHTRTLRAMHRRVENLFPRLRDELHDEGVSRVLLACAVQPDAGLRTLAIELMSGESWLPTDDALGQLSDTQMRAFAHEIVGVATPGRFWVPRLFRLGRMRPEILPEVTKILVEDGVPSYPGLCRRHLESWTGRASDGDSEPESPAKAALARACQTIAARLQQDERALVAKREIAELLTTHPAAAYWMETRQRMMQQMAEHQRRSGQFSPFLALVSVQPIARGEAMVQGQDADFRLPFAEQSVSFEMPVRDAVDPVASALARWRHRQRAATLLAADAPEPAA